MPITITKRHLSGNVSGLGIGISATEAVTNPITIHSIATTATTTIDEVVLFANNASTSTAYLILEVGQSASTAHIYTPLAPRDGVAHVLPTFLLSTSACAIYAYVGHIDGSGSALASAALVQVYGYVNRIVQT